MSVEKNKKTHQRWLDEIWMDGKRNLDAIDEVIGESLTGNWGKDEPSTIDQFKANFKKLYADRDKKNTRIVKTDIHERIGEGDILAVWKTQHYSNGSSDEGLTLWQFENGKIVSFKWFPLTEGS